MTADLFAERLAAVRARFTARLDARLAAIEAVLPQVCGGGENAFAASAAAHHQLHELCGLAPTVGFPQTGRAARAMEQLLLPAVRAKRGLAATEAAALAGGLEKLRAAARAEAHAGKEIQSAG